jgi:hypothetical protein
MSDDIVERLRALSEVTTEWRHIALHHDAAAEIERLRARVAVLEGLLAPLSAEADKHDPPDGDDDHLAWGSVLTIGHLREARAALEAKP